MAKQQQRNHIFYDKVFLIVSGVILLLIIAGAVYYFNQDHYPSTLAAVIDFQGQQLTINRSEVTALQAIALEQNVTLNTSAAIHAIEEQKIVAAQANHLGITATDAQIDAYISQQMSSLGITDLNATLANANLTLAQLREKVAQQLVPQLLFQQEVVSKIQVTDDQLKQIYDANPSQFMVPESVSVKHILICYAGAVACTGNLTKDQALQSIGAIYQALQNNQSFEALAKQFSTDTGSAVNGGDLGAITQGQTVPAFEQVAFSIPIGSFSQPFESPFGYHIVEVYAKQAAQNLSFNQVEPQLKNQVILQQANSMEQSYVNGLMATAKVTVLDKDN